MISKIFIMLCRFSPKLKVILWKRWYQFLAKAYHQREDWNFMNYGYAPLNGGKEKLNLNDEDEENRYSAFLYHHVASAVELKGLNVLEVGSGRGGGADYIKRYLKPKTMTGVDFSENAVKFCNKKYADNGFSFKVGRAESLPFPDNSFDAVVNVESSHCYGSFDSFLAQVKRTLREGGHFLFADFRKRERVPVLREQIRNSGLTIVKETDITLNVVEALKLDSERRLSLIKENTFKPLIKSFCQFAGTEGSRIYEKFRSREAAYVSFVLKKQTT
ncbi:MAG: methyltransferase domain-containing protein [Candidatus Aminicenantes bacterium]|nr:methyltransferase domain-containing protein [Candidatus Aminicenantes bacterium]